MWWGIHLPCSLSIHFRNLLRALKTALLPSNRRVRLKINICFLPLRHPEALVPSFSHLYFLTVTLSQTDTYTTHTHAKYSRYFSDSPQTSANLQALKNRTNSQWSFGRCVLCTTLNRMSNACRLSSCRQKCPARQGKCISPWCQEAGSGGRQQKQKLKKHEN